MDKLLCFGFGYVAQNLTRRLDGRPITIAGTVRRPGEQGRGTTHLHIFDGHTALPDAAFAGVTHLLMSIPPDDQGDAAFRCHARLLGQMAGQIKWAGYLSTTGVYGDHQGRWIDETAARTPVSRRGELRKKAEDQWLELHRTAGLPVHIFRLPGIYGPGRSQLDALRAGRARRIVKPGQVFCRAHVDDIAGVLAASMARPAPGTAYNIADDEPAPPQDVVTYAARLLGVAPPPAVAFADANLSPMAKSFYGESKRIRNNAIRHGLGYTLKYPDYRSGLTAIHAGGG